MNPDWTPEQRHQYIDDKLTAVAQSLELLTHDMHAEQEKTKRLDERERRARAALMAGIAAYMQVLAEEEDGNGEA